MRVGSPTLNVVGWGTSRFSESEKRHTFHLSGKRFTLEDDQWKGNPKNQLVLIGQNLDEDKLYQQIDDCLSLPTTTIRSIRM